MRKLRGAAGPSDLDGYDPESGIQAVFVPTVPKVSKLDNIWAPFDLPKYRDPLHGLLEYLAEVNIATHLRVYYLSPIFGSNVDYVASAKE